MTIPKINKKYYVCWKRIINSFSKRDFADEKHGIYWQTSIDSKGNLPICVQESSSSCFQINDVFLTHRLTLIFAEFMLSLCLDMYGKSQKYLLMINGQMEGIWKNWTAPKAFSCSCSFSLFKIPARMHGRKQKILLVMGKDHEPSGKIWLGFFFLFNMYIFRDQKNSPYKQKRTIHSICSSGVLSLQTVVKLVFLEVLEFWRYCLMNDQ